MGTYTANRIWPTWVQTVAQMRDNDVEVHAFCPKCELTLTVDLDLLCAMRGRSFSLVNRKGRCKRVGCDGRTFFMAARRNAGVPMMRLTDRDRS